MLHAHRQLRASLSKAACVDLLTALSKQGRTEDMLTAFAYMRVAQPAVESSKTLVVLVTVACTNHRPHAARRSAPPTPHSTHHTSHTTPHTPHATHHTLRATHHAPNTE